MKALIIFATLLALGATAQAKLAPLERQLASISADDTMNGSGPSGGRLEADYFRAPQTPYAGGGVFPCRLQPSVFEKTRLAQSCH
jgi:hypothetical protein